MAKAIEVIGTCTKCGDDLCIYKTKNHKRFAKCLNEKCEESYGLPRRGKIEVTGTKCPETEYPIIGLIKYDRLLSGRYIANKKGSFFYAHKPCFTCSKSSSCALLRDLMEDYIDYGKKD